MKIKNILLIGFATLLLLPSCKNEEEKREEPEVHTHEFSSEYEHDSEKHWHKATCEHTDLTKDLEEHNFVDNTCSVCGYTKPVDPTPNYTFTFVGYNCTLNNETTYEEGTQVNLTFNVNEGYHLPESINVVGADSYTYDAQNKSLSLTVNNNVVVAVNAQEDGKPAIHFVKYILMYPGAPEIETVFINEGEYLTKPTDPTREGYDFFGWWLGEFKEEYELFDFTKPITQDYVIYAGWKIQVAKVNFINSITSEIISSQDVEYFAKVSKPTDPTQTGYNFVNWYKDDKMTETYDFSKELRFSENTINIYGKFDKKTYKVTFDPNGGTLKSSESVSIKYQEVVPEDLRPVLERPGYDLSKVTWHFGKEADAREFKFGETKITSNTTLFAHYVEPTKYHIIFKVDRNSYAFDVPEGVMPSPDNVPLTKPARGEISYEFKSWDKEIVPATEDTTYTATFNQFVWRIESDTRDCMNEHLTDEKLYSFTSSCRVGSGLDTFEVEGNKCHFVSYDIYTNEIDEEYYADGDTKYEFKDGAWQTSTSFSKATRARQSIQDDPMVDDWYGAYSPVEGYVVCSYNQVYNTKRVFKFRDGVLWQVQEYMDSTYSHEAWIGHLARETTVTKVGSTNVVFPDFN